ncbi:MAG: GNAT family N-acetyltransferase [Chloroflexota bacterium]|nr:GNAT family N-acetyltransferase [Chloroflexota bacterium]
MNEIIVRPAKPSDARRAGRLLFITFVKKATFIIGLGDEKRAIKILIQLFMLPGHRLSYEFTDIVLQNGRVIGLFTSFPGGKLGKLDRRLDNLILKQYPMRGKLAVILRGWPLIFIKESARDEYFLSNLVVKKSFRGKGVGTQILVKVEEKARQAGLEKASLMVAIENQDARRFYERNGYKIKALHLESNKRVPYLGSGYQRMVKNLTE